MTVVVHGLDGQIYSTVLPLRPQATVYEILTQAAARYRETNMKNAIGPFDFLMQSTLAPEGCLNSKMESIGPRIQGTSGIWEYSIQDSHGKVRR